MIKNLLTAHMFPYPQFIINKESDIHKYTLIYQTAVCIWKRCKRNRKLERQNKGKKTHEIRKIYSVIIWAEIFTQMFI